MASSSHGEKILRTLNSDQEVDPSELDKYIDNASAVVDGSTEQPEWVVKHTGRNLRKIEKLADQKGGSERRG
jgi:hypothetical protein